MRRVVIVGASLAGIAAAEELRLQGFDGDLLLIGAERHHPYDRPPLSKGLLTGDVDVEACRLRPDGWDEEIAVELKLGSPAVALDVRNRTVTVAPDERVSFDGLVIATGARPRRMPGTAIPGVLTLRTLDDAQEIRRRLIGGARLVVVGGGFIGSEVAASAMRHGGQVTIVEALSTPLAGVLGVTVGAALARLHERHGIIVRCGRRVVGVRGVDAVESVVLDDGTVIRADLVIAGLGVEPCTSWLDGSGLTVRDGVVCDAACRTSSPSIVAAGDVARWEHPTLGSLRLEHWDNAVSQGQAAAMSLLVADHADSFAPVPYFWSDQFGHRIQLVGHPRPDDELVVVTGDLDDFEVIAVFGRDGKLTAGLSIDRPSVMRPLRQLLAAGASLVEAVSRLTASASDGEAAHSGDGRDGLF